MPMWRRTAFLVDSRAVNILAPEQDTSAIDRLQKVHAPKRVDLPDPDAPMRQMTSWGATGQVYPAQDLEDAERLVDAFHGPPPGRREPGFPLSDASPRGPAEPSGGVRLAHLTVAPPAIRRLTSRAMRRSVKRASGMVKHRNKSAATV